MKTKAKMSPKKKIAIAVGAVVVVLTAALLAPLEEDKRLLRAVMSQADEFTAEMARAVTGLDGARALLHLVGLSDTGSRNREHAL